MEKHNEMSLFDHLAELRTRLIWVIAVFVLALCGGFYFAGPAIQYLKDQPMAKGVPLISFSPSDAFQVYIQFAVVIGFLVTLPVALYHIWRFVSPGLRSNERRVTLGFIPAAFLLFILGLIFGYYVVFPMVMSFMSGVTYSIGAPLSYGITQYFSFLFNTVTPFGFLFELPIVVIFLTRLRILNPMRLSKFRRVAYLGLTVIAATIAPSDFLSIIIVAIPLIGLYEISVGLSRIIYRKQLKEDAEWESQYANESTEMTGGLSES
ncbi:twin-arginine translocase subunit TatC [Brevibacillus ginsengisoli]|uniref:twin-arginine translocase subunit TatC n=1 Tax=Brevibacillus ginsengisoli TaxID=363854 RepID=UPI003CE7F155